MLLAVAEAGVDDVKEMMMQRACTEDISGMQVRLQVGDKKQKSRPGVSRRAKCSKKNSYFLV